MPIRTKQSHTGQPASTTPECGPVSCQSYLLLFLILGPASHAGQWYSQEALVVAQSQDAVRPDAEAAHPKTLSHTRAEVDLEHRPVGVNEALHDRAGALGSVQALIEPLVVHGRDRAPLCLLQTRRHLVGALSDHVDHAHIARRVQAHLPGGPWWK